MKPLTSVPMIVGSVLNTRVTGSQVVPTIKPKPNRRIASQAPSIRFHTSNKARMMTKSPRDRVMM